jgi:glutamate synthase (NADPH) large chain
MSDLTIKDAERLFMLISNHGLYTGSKRAAEIFADWDRCRPLFRKVMPVEYRRALAEMAKEKASPPWTVTPGRRAQAYENS